MAISAADLIKSVEMDGEVYNIAMQSAETQRAIMFRLGKYGLEPACREIALTMVGGKSVEAVLIGIMGTMMYRIPEDDFNFILDKLLYKVRKVGQDAPVTIADFTGRMQAYTKLAVLAMGVNFADFSSFLTLFQKSIVTEPGQEQTEQNSTPQSTGMSGESASE